MITPIKMVDHTIEVDGDPKSYMELVGKKGDTPPVEKFEGIAILNGSIYTEMDDGSVTVYMYDESTHSWLPIA